MKISAVLFLTDILPHRRRLFNKIVKNKIFNKHTSDEVFTTLKNNGIEGIELMLPQFTRVTDEDLYDVKKMLDKYQIKVFSVHQQLRFFTKTRMTEITELFRIANIFGAKVIVLHVSNAGRQVFNKEYIAMVHALQKKHGILVGYENMEKFFGSLHRGHTWHEDKFADLMKKNDFSITYDVQHLAHSGGDIVGFFKKNKNRIVNVHLSDYRKHILNTNLRPLRYKHLPLGKGELPITEFVQTLKKEKYNGLVTMEIHTDLNGICESAQIVNAALDRRQHEEKK